MRSISFRLFAFLAALLFTLLSLLNYYPAAASRDMITEQKRSKLSSQAAVIAASLSNFSSLSTEDVREVITVLDIQDFTHLIICRNDSLIVYSSGEHPDCINSTADLQTSLGEKTVFRSDFKAADRVFISSCSMPVNHNGFLTGAVFICDYDSESAGIVLDIQARIFTLSVYISAAALLISLIFCASLFRRISSMTRSMRIVGKGDYSHRLSVKGKDELSEFGNEFNILTSRLEEIEGQRRRFVADASHELKTPIASVRLLSDSILQNDGMSSETMREFVADIGSEAERLQRTAEKLLALSRLDDNAVKLVPVPVDVKQVVFDALSVLTRLAREKHVCFHCELDDGCVVMATTDSVYSILFNLMENAVKYNVEAGSVNIKLYHAGDTIECVVEDTGIGIPEEERMRVFDRFYRVDKARSREAGGSGLGLSIVHDTALALGGSVAVGPNTPQGSRFIVSFPAPSPEETGI